MTKWTSRLILFIVVVMALAVAGKIHRKPVSPECKICHCHKTLCARECSEETMCAMQCQRLCDRRKQ